MTDTHADWATLWQQGQQALMEAQAKAAEQFSSIMHNATTAQVPTTALWPEMTKTMMEESQKFWLSLMGAPQFPSSQTMNMANLAAGGFPAAFSPNPFMPHGFGSGLGNAFGSHAAKDPFAAWQDWWNTSGDWSNTMQQQYQQWLNTMGNGPQFADMPNMLAINAKFLEKILEYQQARLNFRTLLAEGWAKAYADFIALYNEQDWEQLDPQKVMEHWMTHTNDALLRVQGSEAFLAAQRALLHTSMKLKQQQHSQVEIWAKEMGMPTRSEMDELIDLVHSLRQEVATLRQSS